MSIAIRAESGSSQNQEKGLPSTSASPAEETALSNCRRHILIVEDSQPDADLIQRAIEATRIPVTFHVVRDGQEAIHFFDRADADPAKPCPDAVILDINLPKRQGGEVLRHMRSRARCAQARVIVVSSSDSHRDRALMQELGADVYFHKPSELDEFMKLGDVVKRVLLPEVQ